MPLMAAITGFHRSIPHKDIAGKSHGFVLHSFTEGNHSLPKVSGYRLRVQGLRHAFTDISHTSYL